MDFSLSDDRRMLKETVSRYVRERYDIAARLAGMASDEGFSRDAWRQFAELGLIGACFDEADGGFGGGGFDLAVLFEELGRGLVVEPFLASAVLGGGLVAQLGDAQQKERLEEVIAGERLMAFAHGEPDSRYELARVTTRAEGGERGWRITGRKAVAINGDTADELVVSARVAGGDADEDRLALFLVAGDSDGVTRRGYPTIDGGRAAEIVLDGVEVEAPALLGAAGEAYPAIEQTVGRAIVCVCAEALGAMETARDMTLEYLRTRRQFGRPIGSFQALQHRMAEMLIEIEQARSAVINAAGHLEAEREVRERHLSAAKNLIGRVGRLVAEEAIQMHGGIGMTQEYALAHYAKRLVMIDHQFGDTDHHLARFIALSRAAA